jgi:HD-like signal output (HDOD) protein
MWSWLKQRGRDSSHKPSPSAPARPAPAPAPSVTRASQPTPAGSVSSAAARTDADPLLPARLVEFVDLLSTPKEPMPAEDLSEHDVLFLEGLIKRLERAQLEVAMLPDVTVRLTEMLRRGDVPVTQYVTLINQDTSLSVEVLRAANSAFYAASARTNSLHEAVMRIGLTRLQSLLMLSLMKTRVLKAGSLRAHAELLIDLSLPLASIASASAKWSGSPSYLSFMRGMLMHVEHLMVLGTISDTSREHRTVITPSNGALLLAFDRSGTDVRRALAHGWGLEDILLKWKEDGDTVNYDGLRRALVCRWLRRPLPEIDGIPADRLEKLMNHVRPRVAEQPPAEASPERATA